MIANHYIKIERASLILAEDKVFIKVKVVMFHNFTVPSSAPVARAPLGNKSSAFTTFECPLILFIKVLVSKFHTWTSNGEPYEPTANKLLEIAVNPCKETVLVIVLINIPVKLFQNMIILSLEADTTVFVSFSWMRPQRLFEWVVVEEIDVPLVKFQKVIA